MRFGVLIAVVIGIVAAIWSQSSGTAPAPKRTAIADPYVWLEDVHGAKPLA